MLDPRVGASFVQDWLLCRPRDSDHPGTQEKQDSSTSPAWSRWIAPGRIGFMSTQRREFRPSPAVRSCGRNRRGHWNRMRPDNCASIASSSGIGFPLFLARSSAATAVPTAPPVQLPVQLVTSPLPSEHWFQQHAQLVFLRFRPGSPLLWHTTARRPSRLLPSGFPPTSSPASPARFR